MVAETVLLEFTEDCRRSIKPPQECKNSEIIPRSSSLHNVGEYKNTHFTVVDNIVSEELLGYCNFASLGCFVVCLKNCWALAFVQGVFFCLLPLTVP